MNPHEFYATEREDRKRIAREAKAQAEAFVSVFDDPENPNWQFVNDACLNVKLEQKYGGLYCPHCQRMHAILRTQAVRLGSAGVKEVWRLMTRENIEANAAPADNMVPFTKESEPGEVFRHVYFENTSPPPEYRGRKCFVKLTQRNVTDKTALLRRGKRFTFGQVAAWEAAKEEAKENRKWIKVHYRPPFLSADCMAITDQPRNPINPGKYASYATSEPADLYKEW